MYGGIDFAYWLHQEFVDRTHTPTDPLALGLKVDEDDSLRNFPSAILCEECIRTVTRFPDRNCDFSDEAHCFHKPAQWKHGRPKHSVANGLDFGDARRLHLPALTPLETRAIALSRPYMTTFKMSGANAGKGEQEMMRGHCISFKQPEAPPKTLDAFQLSVLLHQQISITFVGPRDQLERRLSAALPFGATLRNPNFDRMLQYLRFYIAINRNPEYTKMTLPQHGDDGADWQGVKEYFSGSKDEEGSLLNQLFSNIKVEEDKEVIAVDVVCASADPAKQQQQATEVHGDGDPILPVDSETVMEEIFVGNSPEALIDDESVHEPGTTSLQAMQSFFPNNVKVPRAEDPQSDYGEIQAELADACPDLFLLGVAPQAMGSLSKAQSRHLLLQYNPHFGSNSTILFMMFNQLRRASLAIGVSGEVRKNSEAFGIFRKLSSDPDLLEKLDRAIINPKTDEALELTRQIDKAMLVVGRHAPFSSASRHGKKGDFIAHLRFFGGFTYFTTLSPAPTGDPPGLRMTFGTKDNHSFPACDSGFLERVQDGRPLLFQDHHGGPAVEKKMSHSELLRRATRNPASSAESYRRDVQAYYSTLLGHPTESHSRKTQKHQGVFGVAAAGCGVTEQSGKGFSHNHGLATAGVPAWAIEVICGCTTLDKDAQDLEKTKDVLLYEVALKEAQEALGEYIDTCTTAELSPTSHVQNLIACYCGFPSYVSQHYVTRAKENGEGRQAHIEHTVARTGVHSIHGSRCRKGNAGETQCSQCYPQPCGGKFCPRLLKLNGEVIKAPLPPQCASSARTSDGLTSPLKVDSRTLLAKPTRRKIDAEDVLKKIQASSSTKSTTSTPHAASEATDDANVIDARKWFVLQQSDDDGASDAGVLDSALVELKLAQHEGLRVSDECLSILIKRLPPAYRDAHLPAALEKRNGRVTDYNETISSVRGCNTAIYHLGCGQAQLSALFYCMDYVTKNTCELESCLSLAAAANRHVRDYPSTAEDSGTEPRTAQHFLNRLLNSKLGLEEFSSMQAAGVLLGDPPEQTTHNSVNLNVAWALDSCTELMKKKYGQESVAPCFHADTPKEGNNNSGESNSDSDDGESEESDPENNETPLGSADGSARHQRRPESSSEGTVKPDVIEGKLVLANIEEA